MVFYGTKWNTAGKALTVVCEAQGVLSKQSFLS